MTLIDFLFGGFTGRRHGAVSNILIGTGVGLTVGIIAGLLFAPRTGEEARAFVADTTKDAVKKVKKVLNSATVNDVPVED